MSGFAITLARPVDPRVTLAEIVYVDRLAPWPHIVDVTPSPQAVRYRFRQETITDPASLVGILRRADAAGEIVVRGEPNGPTGRRAIYDSPEKGPAGLRVVPRNYVGFDWDNLPLELETLEPIDPAILDDPAEWQNWAEPDPLLDPEVGARIALKRLPPNFRERDCIIQISASAGYKPGFRLRTWHLLHRAITGADLKTWCQPAIKAGLLDPVTLNECQPHYVACTFVGGPDPCPSRFIVYRQNGEIVPVADIEAIRERQRLRHRALLRSSLPPTGMIEGSAAEAAIQRCIDAVAQSGEGARHPAYLEQSARARAICERTGFDWSSVAARLKSAYSRHPYRTGGCPAAAWVDRRCAEVARPAGSGMWCGGTEDPPEWFDVHHGHDPDADPASEHRDNRDPDPTPDLNDACRDDEGDFGEPLDILGNAELIGSPELTADSVPATLYRFAKAEGERLVADPVPIAIFEAAACSVAISDEWRIKPKKHDPWTQQARIRACNVKPPGARGTDILRSALWPIAAREKELRQTFKREHAAWAARMEGLKGKELARAKKEDPEPKQQRLLTNDATVEALSQILEGENEGAKVGYFADELAAFLDFGRYKSCKGGGGSRAVMLQVFDGGPQQID